MLWFFKNFNDLTLHELYGILKVREAVFNKEQRCTDYDIDGQDLTAQHLFCMEDDRIVAYARIILHDTVVKVGRVLVQRAYRCRGLGHELIKKVLQEISRHYPKMKIVLSAQAYLEQFYKTYGFKVISEPYDEAGIPHITMEKIV